MRPSLRIWTSAKMEEGLSRVTKGARLRLADVRQLIQGAVPGYRHHSDVSNSGGALGAAASV